ncbi:unnamed protein product [Brassica napus]|uniref:ADP-ribosyl cyclase/cyclic ADP-ribose hydrolase n=2 Tax=Brassica napus TaxID=3708 RepID=A0A816VEL8_BRANA|nr:unnamed protein product [Brassica napus]
MVRSEPCVLFAQTFVHPQLDEYVDEVIFAEPVIITACEFLEQNASSSSQAVSLLGATSPPSFALEVFVRCEGESKFKRLCNPFLYTPSAPYPLEVEAVVTNHLVVRGSYRSLSLIVYGNIVKDLGQYNIILEGRSVTDIVNSTEGNLEDLPLVLHSVNRTIEECLSSLDIVSLPLAAVDVPVEVKRLLQLLVKVFDQLATDDVLNKFVDTVVSGVSSYVTDNVDFFLKNKNCTAVASSVDSGIFHDITDKVKKDILDLNDIQESDVPLGSSELLSFLESETSLATSQQLVDMLSPYIQFESDSLCTAFPQLSKGKATLLGLSLAFLLCSGREGCLHFVNSGGMDQLVFLFGPDVQNSTTITLLLLGVVEQATRHAVGCEGFLGWWPREDGSIPSGKSEGYCLLLKLLMQKPCHEVASLAIYILHRLRIYEIVSRYEFAVLSALESLSNSHGAATHNLNMQSDAKSQLQKLQKLMNSLGSVEDPSPSAYAERSLVFDHSEGWLSYKATSKLTASWACPFSNSGTDSHMLSLLKERGFLPLSAALLSIPGLHSELGDILDVFTDIAMFIGNIILSLMFSRTGLSFLLHHSQLTATIIQSLKGSVDLNKEECVPLRYASVLISKGFTCSLLEIGINLEVHLRVVSAVDRLLKSSPQTEEFLGILWELRDVSRSDCGREALLTLGVFPEALAVLIEALNSVKDTDPAVENSGISPLNLAICHSAAEIFEVIVSDSTVSCLHAWIEHAPVLHKALHTLSPGGSNRKDAPSRLLKWIDAGVVYHKHGVVGLLRYAAVLASGGDAQLSSSSILALDLTSAENGVGESSNVSEMNGLDNLEKVILEKSFEGVNLSDSSISQLTTALRILALISDNTTVAAALYDEGAVTVVYAILVNCSFMFERSSNIYDYLVDDDHGCSSISDFLSERNREQSLVDLLIPSLVLLISVLQRLQDSKEQYRNTKLMKALLRLHREVSPKLAACAADLSSHYPDSALGFGAVCHLIVSALVCWPVYGWMPGLFHSLLTGFQTSSVPALGPKETCSFLCILSDILPEEGVWFWKSGMPLLSGLRKLAVGTLMSPQKEKQINWYLEPAPLEKLLNYLTPNLDKIAKIIQHHAVSALVVIQDMLRVFIVRIACQRVEHASILLRPIFASIREGILDESSTRETEAYKVHRYLNFLASLLEHPQSKGLLLEEGIVQLLVEVLQRCYDSTYPSEDRVQEFGIVSESSVIRWCIPVFRSISLLCHSQVPLSCFPKKELLASLSAKDCASIFPFVLKFCQVLPIGNELLSCLCAFKDLVSCSEGQDCLVSLLVHLFSGPENPAYDTNNLSLDQVEMKKNPPFLSCWIKLLNSVNSKDGLSVLAIKAVNVLSVSSIRLCIDGKSLDSKKVAAIKSLFGLPSDFSDTDTFRVENIGLIEQMVTLLSSMTSGSDTSATAEMKPCLHEVSQSLLSLLKDGNIDDITSCKIALVSTENFDMNDVDSENIEDDFLQRGLEDKFWWECPETLPERLPQSSLSAKRKLPTVESSSRRAKGENSSVDIPTQSSIQRVGSASLPPAPTRRDTFRQRKTNTSRPPSMHVDDYVARERSIDTAGNSNAITISRAGSSSGRPPSVHVDEYMARERRGQNPSTIVVGEATAQVKTPTPARETEKAAGKPKQFKADPDDDLQGIDIVFDGEECEGADDKLPFLQPDENLMQPAPVMVEQNSPHSIVEETESDANGSSQFSHMGTPLASNVDENAQSEYSSRISVSRPEMSLIREPSISSDRKFVEQADETNKMAPLKSEPGFVPGYNNIPGSSGQNLMDPRVGPQGFYSKSSQQQHSGHIQGGFSGRGVYDQKMLPNQPPLPLVPPPSSSHVMQHSSDSLSNQSSPFSRGTPSSGGGPIRHMPPHPSAIPQYSSNPYASLPPRTSTVQTFGYNQGGAGTTEQQQQSGPGIDPQPGTGMTSYPPPNLMQSGYSRPFYGNPMHQGGDKQQQNMMPVPQSLNPHSIPQQLPSMQLQRPMQPPQHVRPPMQISQPSEQGISLQNQYQIPLHPMQMMQQPQVQPYYHPPQQQEISHVQQPQPQQQAVQGQQGAGTSQRQESGMSLHDYLQSPETIQALLSNREKLCELLEQNPKLMQMLQVVFKCLFFFLVKSLSVYNIKLTGKISAFYSMEPPDEAEAPYTFGDRSTSDIVVRLRNEEGRDDWIYCHSKILTEKSRYFADRLSDKWPTCKILDSRYCVEVICQESDYDHHINLLRLLYVVSDDVPEDQLCHNVKSALGILCVAKELDCPLIVTACVNYLEAVPWEEGEEEEMLRVVPMIGPEAEPVLARLQPVDPSAVAGIFSSGFRFATSSPPQPLCDIKASAQEQIEYMITEDDDAPLLIADEGIKLEVKECVKSLFARFFQCLEEVSSKNGLSLKMVVSDLSWAFQILTKMEMVRDFVVTWVDTSEKLVKVVEAMEAAAETVEIRVKVTEVTSKVVEAIGYGTVILPTVKRLQMVKLWLPFVRETKPLVDSAGSNQEEDKEEGVRCKIDGEIWQALESSFVSIILALPSSDQAEILTEWLSKNGVYPDLTEAFEVWCFRSKVAKRRLVYFVTISSPLEKRSQDLLCILNFYLRVFTFLLILFFLLLTMMASSSSFSSYSSMDLIRLYHVFLSFRGEDVRKGFLSHVLKEFQSKGIIVFIDNGIKRGESVGPVLVGAIRHSRVAVVLLSRNYASSSWCLNELVEIMKCREEVGQTVMTIFYQVDPSDVMKQTGDFGKAFDITCKGKTEELKKAWRQALQNVAGIAGYHSSNCGNEADLINKVASDVMVVLGFTPSKDFDDFVGIRARITEIKSKLIFQSEKVKVIGIFGPAGIGKTTTARVFYNQLSPYFQFNTFLENIKGSYEKPCGNDYQLKLRLQKNLLCQIFNQSDIEVRHLRGAQEMLSDKKVLVVLDEVDHWWQLEEMAKQPGWVGPGSMIIITTEDRKLLKALGLGSDHIYKMKFPTSDESLQIFCQYAFGQKSPDDGFESLAREVTWLVGNLPLGLRVMGSYLRGMSKDEWIEALPWLRSTLDREIESTLRFSYDALRDNEKTLFLHVACLFSVFYASIFKSYFANSSLEVNHGLEVLAQKSLITIDHKHGRVYMHRLMAQMGREIVKKQSTENPGKRQFLTDTKDISHVLDEDTATGNVLGIHLDTTWTGEEIQINKSAFQGMNNLQFLSLFSYTIHTPEGLDCLPDKLISLHWYSCPLRIWPSKFSGKFLVDLVMHNSRFEMLWEGIKPLPRLKRLDLSFSRNLKKLPDLSEATSLEELRLYKCKSLLEITSSIGNATKLYRLDISGCEKIKDFPNVPDSIVELNMSETGIKEVPPWIENLLRLRELRMHLCKKLKTISPNISKLENLEFLALSNHAYHACDDEDYTKYEYENVIEALIEWGPDFKRSWILESDFDVHYILPICLPEKAFFTSPISLRLCSSGIKTIPDCTRYLSGLLKLDVKECSELVALPPLPHSLIYLDAQGCESLKTIDSSSFQINPNICLNFAKCYHLEKKARKLIYTSACKYAILPGEEVPAHFTHRASSGSLTISLTPRPLPSSFRFKACILLSKVHAHPGDTSDDDYNDEESESSWTGTSCSIRGKQNGITVGGGSNQLRMPALYGNKEHLYIFEDSFSLNQDSPEAEETTLTELTFVFRVDDETCKVEACGLRLIEANNESAGGEDEDEDDDDDDGEGGEDEDDDHGEDDEGNTEANNETEGEESRSDEDEETRSRKRMKLSSTIFLE